MKLSANYFLFAAVATVPATTATILGTIDYANVMSQIPPGQAKKLGGGLRNMAVQWEGESLFWFNADHDSGLRCARPTGDYIESKDCYDSDRYKWEVKALNNPDYAFQIESEDEGTCVAVTQGCWDGSPLKLVNCDQSKAVWYLSNIGTFNSYYCWVRGEGTYYIDPKQSSYYQLENDEIEDSTGMFLFASEIPEENFSDLTF